MSTNEKRTCHLHVMLSIYEKERLRFAAKKERKSMSDLIRKFINNRSYNPTFGQLRNWLTPNSPIAFVKISEDSHTEEVFGSVDKVPSRYDYKSITSIRVVEKKKVPGLKHPRSVLEIHY